VSGASCLPPARLLAGSVGPGTGWQPRPLLALAEEAGGARRPLGMAPAWLKTHSFGEYVFDWAWAQAAERAGLAYYPKLQIAVPFTPASGPRLLLAPQAGTEAMARTKATARAEATAGTAAEQRAAAVRAALIAGAERAVTDLGLSSAHATFLTDPDRAAFAAAGWLMRTDIQFHWPNPGYADFESFLATLRQPKRKQIRRERRRIAEAGVTLHSLTGDDLRPAHWDFLYRVYMDTGRRKWGRPYLTRDFFHQLGARMADRALMVLAARDGNWIAAALNLIGGDALYGRYWGRYWGCREPVAGLHFEACYYQAMEFAIARGLARVEAGAQGPHKLARGYLPQAVHSAHHIAHPGLARAVADYLAFERAEIAREIAGLAAESPYRTPPAPP